MSYRLKMKIAASSDMGLLDVIGLGVIEDVKAVLAGARGESPIEFELQIGNDKHRNIGRIASRLSELHLETMSRLRDELRAKGSITAGPLTLAAKELVWKRSDPLTRDEVESIELFDASPIQLRVMKHGKVLPYGKADTDDIPDLIEVMELARELGYRVRGIELLAALRAAVA